MRRRIVIVAAIALVIAASFGTMAWSGVLTPTAPPGWAQVHAGLNRSAVLSLAGSPQQSGWPENVTETWERRGAICNHRLFVCYRGRHLEDGYVQDVWEGTWLRGYGWLHPRKDSK